MNGYAGPVGYRCLRPIHSVMGATRFTLQCQGSMRLEAEQLRCDNCGRSCALEPAVAS